MRTKEILFNYPDNNDISLRRIPIWSSSKYCKRQNIEQQSLIIKSLQSIRSKQSTSIEKRRIRMPR